MARWAWPERPVARGDVAGLAPVLPWHAPSAAAWAALELDQPANRSSAQLGRGPLPADARLEPGPTDARRSARRPVPRSAGRSPPRERSYPPRPDARRVAEQVLALHPTSPGPLVLREPAWRDR